MYPWERRPRGIASTDRLGLAGEQRLGMKAACVLTVQFAAVRVGGERVTCASVGNDQQYALVGVCPQLRT